MISLDLHPVLCTLAKIGPRLMAQDWRMAHAGLVGLEPLEPNLGHQPIVHGLMWLTSGSGAIGAGLPV